MSANGSVINYRVCPEEIKIDKTTGLVKADCAPIFRIVRIDGQVFVQFLDANRARVEMRGAAGLAIPLDLLLAKLRELSIIA